MGLAEKAGLADALIAKEKDLATTGRQFVDDLPQLLDFGLTPDEWGLRAGFLDSLRAYETPGLDRLDPPLDSHLAQGLEHEAVDDRSRRRLPDGDRARVSDALQARGHVVRVAERDRLWIGGSHQADRDLARVDPYPGVEIRDSPCALDLAGVARDLLEDAQGRTRGALGIVLVRARHAVERRDPVAHVRAHRAPELLDRPSHAGHAIADEGLDLGRLEALAEAGRADDVGEERSNRSSSSALTEITSAGSF